MNGKKCSFAKNVIKYIGHILSTDGILIDPSKANVIIILSMLQNAQTYQKLSRNNKLPKTVYKPLFLAFCQNPPPYEPAV